MSKWKIIRSGLRGEVRASSLHILFGIGSHKFSRIGLRTKFSFFQPQVYSKIRSVLTTKNINELRFSGGTEVLLRYVIEPRAQYHNRHVAIQSNDATNVPLITLQVGTLKRPHQFRGHETTIRRPIARPHVRNPSPFQVLSTCCSVCVKGDSKIY